MCRVDESFGQRRQGWRLFTAAAVVAASLSAQAVTAAPANEPARNARPLAYAGIEAYAVADYRLASEKLEEAFRISPLPSFGLWSARALVKLGRLVEAERRYREVAATETGSADTSVQRTAKLDAAREHQELLPRIPLASFTTTGRCALRIEIDGASLGGHRIQGFYLINPGPRVVVARCGSEQRVTVADLAEGEKETVSFAFADEPPLPVDAFAVPDARAAPSGAHAGPGGLEVAGWLSLAGAGIAVAVGTGAHLISRGQRAELERGSVCIQTSCFPPTTDEYRSYETWRSVQIVGFLSGGLLAAGGVTLILAARSGEEEGETSERRTIALRLAPASAAFMAHF